MSRPALIVVVLLASYAMFNLACSLVVAVAWRFKVSRAADAPARERAAALLRLRAIPTTAAAVITLAGVVPAFAMFEPDHGSEDVGPVALLFALIAILQLAASTVIALASSWHTRIAARQWLRAAVPLDVHPPVGVPTFAIDTLAPIVAIVGVFKPKLIAARSVIEACSFRELTTIVAHERGHLHAHDNLKRWLMVCAPDALRWTPIHHEIAAAWHDAAEDAADDAATEGDAASRVDLAELLVKIARLTPAPSWRAATVSPFTEPGSLNRRVRRLLASDLPQDQRRDSSLRRAVVLMTTLAAVSIALQPAVLEQLYLAIEAVIAFRR